MKKLILMLLVLVGGVIQANATDYTKRIYIKAENTSWRENTTGLNIYIWNSSTNADVTNSWPGNSLERIPSTDWFYVDINSNVSTVKCKINTNNEPRWETNESGQFSLLDNNVIYLTSDYTPNLNAFSFDGYVLAKGYFSSSDKITSLTQDGLELTKTIDMSSEEDDVNFWVFPAILSNGYYVGELAISPNTDNNFELSSFIKYEDNIKYGDSKKWVEKAHQKYDVTINLSTNKFTFTPYFERTISGVQYGSYYYATFSSANQVAVPSGVNAYYASSSDGNKVTMNAFSSGIRSTDGAFLRFSTNNTSYKFSATNTTDSPTTNYLKPASSSGIPANSYVFASQNGKVGFFKVSNGLNGDYTNKAYLQISSSAPSFDIEFGDGETTGIYRIVIDNHQETGNDYIYDLSGRRLAEPTKGINIVNGKKVIIK